MTDLVALRGFVDELALAGVADAVICPGSRSAPLALALRAHPGIVTRVLLDERSAGYFALGLARASGRPVAVLVTSGTAAANLLPAAVEASLGRVPLVLVTADRPPELRDRGAAQAIDQDRLFGVHAKWYAELPLLDGAEVTRRHVRGVAARAVAVARQAPAGPVHLDAPFREPLVPDGPLGPLGPLAVGGVAGSSVAASGTSLAGVAPAATPARSFGEAVTGRRALAPGQVADLAARLAALERGVIVAGPQGDPALGPAVARLAAALDWPILADPLSLVRCGPHDRSRVLARGDHLLRPSPWLDDHVPEVVLRVGAPPTSKPLLLLLEDRRPSQVVVDEAAGWREPAIIATTHVHADPTATLQALAERLGAGTPAGSPGTVSPRRTVSGGARTAAWLDDWLAAERAADRALRNWLAATAAAAEPFEGAPFADLGDLLPDGAILWAGSSMPVRDLDAFLPSSGRAIRPMANRGANGIDGVVSSALGAAATGAPVVLVIGDLALLHDLGGLVAGRGQRLSATIVLLHNDGGGIFSFLPQATAARPEAGLPTHFEELFGTPHGIDPGPLVEALGAEHRRVGAVDLPDALAASIGAPGMHVLELRTERARNVALHREAAAAVRAALDDLVRAGSAGRAAQP